MQLRTIEKVLSWEGPGLHTGEYCRLDAFPAAIDTGIFFWSHNARRGVAANINHVISTFRSTDLGDAYFSIKTVEHVLSAVAASHISNIRFELYGPEIPI